MENVTFILPSGAQIIPEDYGLILKSFEAPGPKAKLNLINISGRDGSLDMTDWAGETRYEDREVKIAFRDMRGDEYGPMLDKIHGQHCKIIHSVDNTLCYIGRCSDVDIETRRHVTDIELSFICFPFRMYTANTVITKTVTSGLTIPLKAKRMSAVPTVTLTDACTLIFDSVTKSLAAGTHVIPEYVITKAGKTMSVSGSGTITIQWTDGVI